MSSRGQVHGGVQHGRGCACPKCDPKQAALGAARERARLAPPAPPAASAPRPTVRRSPTFYAAVRDARTARLRELLKSGAPFGAAAEIIEREFSQPRGTHGIEKKDD